MSVVHGEARILKRRLLASCPDVREVRETLERSLGLATGGQRRLAHLVGCHPQSIRNWESGRPVAACYVPKLVEIAAELRTKESPAAPPRLPLLANEVAVRIEGEQALATFALKVPGQEPKLVAEVLVPRSALLALVKEVNTSNREC